MAKSTTKNAIVDLRVRPVAVGTEEALVDALASGAFAQRRRPTVAINADGELVICSRHTANKHGWEVQGKLFKRDRGTAKQATNPTPAKAESDKPTASAEADKPAKKAAKKTGFVHGKGFVTTEELLK